MAKVLIIGLDGATWTLLGPWAERGLLPHVAALMARGTRGVLRSTIPALTLPAWSSFMTGKNPGRHGIFAFRRLPFRGYDARGIANTSDLRAATLWDIAGQAGKRVGVINVPPSYPPRPVNGFMVGCMLTPPGERRFTEPPELADELGDYQIDAKVPPDLDPERPDYVERALSYVAAVHEQTARRAAVTRALLERHPCDLACVVFYALDRLQHFFWRQLQLPDGSEGTDAEAPLRRALHAAVATLDRAVGELVRAAGPEATVVLVSDHGFAPAPERLVRVNRWLADQGLLHEHRLQRLRRKIVRKLPADLRARYKTVQHLLTDRTKTRAWSDHLDGAGIAGIWINVRGRYPEGCVAPGAAYEKVRRRIVDGLRGLREDGGGPVFRAVHRREEIYSGPFVEEAPDVLAVCAERYGIGWKSYEEEELKVQGVFAPFDLATWSFHLGEHDPNGIYLFAGPPVRPAGEACEYAIEAIAPTALHLLGLPVPRDMEGPVCTAALDPGYLRANPIRYSDETTVPAPARDWESTADAESVAEHLRALGYFG